MWIADGTGRPGERRLALEGRGVPLLIEPALDEVSAGVFDGLAIENYWAWKYEHASSERFLHGEIVDEALLRYVGAYCHGAPSRCWSSTSFRCGDRCGGWRLVPLADATVGNAVRYLLDDNAVFRAAAALALVTRPAQPEPLVA